MASGLCIRECRCRGPIDKSHNYHFGRQGVLFLQPAELPPARAAKEADSWLRLEGDSEVGAGAGGGPASWGTAALGEPEVSRLDGRIEETGDGEVGSGQSTAALLL